jgi:hypothetical protein
MFNIIISWRSYGYLEYGTYAISGIKTTDTGIKNERELFISGCTGYSEATSLDWKI